MPDADKGDTSATEGVRYPDCVVQLAGTNANAVLIFRRVRRAIVAHLTEAHGMEWADAVKVGNQFQTEATAGDYRNVLATCERWVTVF